MAALRRAYARGDLDLAGATELLHDPTRWHAFVDALFATDWVVYAKPAFGGASAVLRYLGRYTHRVAISNYGLIACDGERVTFRWKDYAHGNQWRRMTLTAMEFLRRSFLRLPRDEGHGVHVSSALNLGSGFVGILPLDVRCENGATGERGAPQHGRAGMRCGLRRNGARPKGGSSFPFASQADWRYSPLSN